MMTKKYFLAIFTLSTAFCILGGCNKEEVKTTPISAQVSPNGTPSNNPQFTPDPCKMLCGKPVIYLYPQKAQRVNVKLDFKGKLTCTYPEYKDGWKVLASPDGTLINERDKREYSYLFWEGETKKFNMDYNSGFIVEGCKTLEFLQKKLSLLGLTPKEYNDFIVFWLPKMKDNKYNFIHFAGEEYEDVAGLEIEPKPDSVLRVFMVFKPLDKTFNVAEQEIQPFKRSGFTVVEWGASEIPK